MPFLDEIAARIVEQGAGTIGVDLFMSTAANLPTGGDPFTVLIEYGGTTSRRTQNNKSTQRPSCHVTVTANSYKDARARAVQVYNALGGDEGLFEVVLSGVRYLSIIPNQQLYDGSLDATARAQVKYNFDAEKEPS
jgi:hypothetical protein